MEDTNTNYYYSMIFAVFGLFISLFAESGFSLEEPISLMLIVAALYILARALIVFMRKIFGISVINNAVFNFLIFVAVTYFSYNFYYEDSPHSSQLRFIRVSAMTNLALFAMVNFVNKLKIQKQAKKTEEKQKEIEELEDINKNLFVYTEEEIKESEELEDINKDLFAYTEEEIKDIEISYSPKYKDWEEEEIKDIQNSYSTKYKDWEEENIEN